MYIKIYGTGNIYRLRKDNYGNFVIDGSFDVRVGDTIDCLIDDFFNKKKAEAVIERYKNGKETVSLLLGINDYFDDKGDMVISDTGKISKMLFEIGDIIVPYKRNEFGKDEPISLYHDGTPKQFEVVGVNMIYDGATMQKITAQEAIK